MRRLYPFVHSTANIWLLISFTFSFITFPFFALIIVHTVCKMLLGMPLYSSQVAGTIAFMAVSLYSIVGIVYLYRVYFKKK